MNWLSRRALALAFTAALAVALATVAPAQGPRFTERLTFLHFNDAYQISPRRGLGGLAPLATLIKRERARVRNSMLTFGGDLISPSLLSGLTKGAHMIELANALGIQAAVLGNHEFDFGPDIARERIQESKFPWLGANVVGADGKPWGGVAATAIVPMGSVKVGFFGVITPAARLYIRGGGPATFAPVLPAARAAMDQLRAEGAQVLVALTHMNLDEDRQLARELRGLHLILGGHEHIPITVYERGVLILKAGSDAEFLGVVDLDIAIERDVVVAIPSWRLIANHSVAADPDVQALVRGHEQRLDRELGQPIGRTETQMDSHAETVRLREAAIGNLVADALVAATGADAALVNGGGLRGNRDYPAGSTLSARDVFSELPFGNILVVLETKGSVLKAVMEHGLSRLGQEFGGFPQIAGIRLTYDPARPSGNRIVAMTVAGAPLEPDRLYRFATSDFLAEGGDGYAMLRDARRVVDANAGPLMAGVVIEYIKQRGSVSARPEGRIAPR